MFWQGKLTVRDQIAGVRIIPILLVINCLFF